MTEVIYQLSSLSQGTPVCVTCAALHRFAPLGTVLGSMVWRAQPFVTKRTGGYNILTSGWAATHFSPGSARIVFILGICSPLLGSCPSCFESTCASEMGDCTHARDIVIAWVSMTCVAQAWYFCVCAHVCIRVLICSVL